MLLVVVGRKLLVDSTATRHHAGPADGILDAVRGKRWVIGASTGVVLTYLGYFNIPGAMSGDALVTSIGWQDGVDYAACYSASAEGSRECVIWPAVDRDVNKSAIRNASGSYFPVETYEVVTNGRCWTARKTEASDVRPPLPVVLGGCVAIGDNIRVLGRVFGDDPNDHFELHPDDQ